MPQDSETTPAQRRDALRAEIATLNLNALCNIMLRHGLVLPNEARGWRATKGSKGHITGLEHLGELTILCTDGVVGYFRLSGGAPDNPKATLYGHIDSFSGSVEPLHSLPKETSAAPAAESKVPKAPKPKSTVPSVSAALALLRSLTSPK